MIRSDYRLPFHLSLLLMAATLYLPSQANAVTCATFSSPGWSLTYDPVAALATTTTTSVTVTCTRQKGDPKNLALTIAANSGLQPAGTINQAKAAGNALLQYNNYADAAYTLVWGLAGSTLSIPLVFGAVNSSATVTAALYAKIPAGQVSASAGTYSDLVTMTLNNGATQVATGTFPVTVAINPNCVFTTPPGAITLNYASFQTTNATASASFSATCTNALPYTLSLDATSGTLLGLTYTLSVPAGTFTGTGLAQAYLINAAIAAGQAGTCATATCTGSVTHTLIITY